MKTIAYLNWTAVCLTALALNATALPHNGQPVAAEKHDHTYAGTVAAVDANEHVLKVHGLFLSRDFDLGNTCSYVFLDTGSGDIKGLHAGQKVVVTYRNIDGMRVAALVEQEPMLFEGRVEQVDANNHTMSVRHMGLEKTFQIAPGCPIDLHNNRSGTLAEVLPGNSVTVTYETPYDKTIARRITQNTQTFTGELTALDLNARTAKATGMLDRKSFDLAPNCIVVLNGKAGANLRDVKLGERMEFDYIDANGANIVTRIAEIPQSAPSMTASTGSPHEYQTPMAGPNY